MHADDANHILQTARRSQLNRIGAEPWVTVYSRESTSTGNGSYFCALVRNASVETSTPDWSWRLQIGGGLPRFSRQYTGHGTTSMYHRFGSGDETVEPFVFVRSFHEIKEGYIELSEEFRHFFNLYYDAKTNSYIRIDEHGSEETVAIVTADSVKVKTRTLRQFLAARQMSFAIFFDFVAFATTEMSFDHSRQDEEITRGDLRYSFHINAPPAARRVTSRLLGTRIILPLPREECGIWPYEKTPQSATFIIGVDGNGHEIIHTCALDVLNTPGAPDFLTPVVFRREVLKRYYENPEKYSVHDGYLSCGNLWSLHIDNDGRDHVVVFLGYLASLGIEDQYYWRSFNIPPTDSGLSDTARRRALLAEFVDATSPDLVFKRKFVDFQEAWEKKFCWQLFRVLRAEDEHVLKLLRVPLNESVVEFEQVVLALSTLLQDSLNDSELVSSLPPVTDEKSIDKFRRFLVSKRYPPVKRDIDFLRALQLGRSKAGSAHRKGDDYQKVTTQLGWTHQTKRGVFTDFLRQANEMLDGLTEFFLRAPEPPH